MKYEGTNIRKKARYTRNGPWDKYFPLEDIRGCIDDQKLPHHASRGGPYSIGQILIYKDKVKDKDIPDYSYLLPLICIFLYYITEIPLFGISQ